MIIFLFAVLFFMLFLMFIFCLTKVAGQSSRQEDDRQQILFLESYRKEHQKASAGKP